MSDPLPTVPGGYRTLIIDPPWPYAQPLGRGKKEGEIARGGLPYVPMTIQDILNLSVEPIVAKEAMCFLWVTNSHLPVGFQVLKNYGFEYKTTLTWTKYSDAGKVQIGLGYWLRGATEHVLFGIRGNPRSKMRGPNGATGLGYSTAILAPRGLHSAKPERLYEIAEGMGEAPRVELFARARRDGWDAWGNQAPTTPTIEEFVPPPADPQSLEERW